MSAEERLGDAVHGLRLTDGINLDDIWDRRVDVWQRYGANVIEAGLLRHEGARLWLTRRGMLLAHEVMAVFV
jgi:coproporphyrinogen III oxidase-like Fe-S oxidoreductase